VGRNTNKAFTHWINTDLEKRDESIENITEGFSTGLKLITLFEVLSGKTIDQKYSKNPKLKVHKINNCFIALTFLQEDCGVSGLTISSEDFVEGKQMNILLGFCWMLLRHFQAPTPEKGKKGSSFEANLLAWVRDTLEGYDDINLDDGFKSDCWFNGKAILGLVNEFDRNILDYKSYNPEEKERNCLEGLRIAEEKIGLPQIIEHEELAAGKTSDKNLVLYLSLFYNAYKEKAQGLSKDSILDRIKELEETLKRLTEENENLRNSKLHLEHSQKDLSEKLSVLSEEKSTLLSSKEEVETILGSLQESYDSEKTSLQTTIDELSANVDLLKASGEDATTNLEQAKEEMKKERDLVKEELAKTQEQLNKEKEELEAEQDELTNNLKRATKTREKLEEEMSANQDTHTKSIHALRTHLLQHVQMMHVYKNFLEQDREYESEDLHIVMETELEDMSFADQIKALDTAINEEYEKLVGMEVKLEIKKETVPKKEEPKQPKSSRKRK